MNKWYIALYYSYFIESRNQSSTIITLSFWKKKKKKNRWNAVDQRMVFRSMFGEWTWFSHTKHSRKKMPWGPGGAFFSFPFLPSSDERPKTYPKKNSRKTPRADGNGCVPRVRRSKHEQLAGMGSFLPSYYYSSSKSWLPKQQRAPNICSYLLWLLGRISTLWN